MKRVRRDIVLNASTKVETLFHSPQQMEPALPSATIGTTAETLPVKVEGEIFIPELNEVKVTDPVMYDAQKALTEVMECEVLSGFLTATDIALMFKNSESAPVPFDFDGHRFEFNPVECPESGIIYLPPGDVHQVFHEAAKRWDELAWDQDWEFQWRRQASFLRRMFQLTADQDIWQHMAPHSGVGPAFEQDLLRALINTKNWPDYTNPELSWRLDLIYKLNRHDWEDFDFTNAFMAGDLNGFNIVYPSTESEFVHGVQAVRA